MHIKQVLINLDQYKHSLIACVSKQLFRFCCFTIDIILSLFHFSSHDFIGDCTTNVRELTEKPNLSFEVRYVEKLWHDYRTHTIQGIRSLTIDSFAFFGESPAYQSNQLLQTTEHVHVLLYVCTNVGQTLFSFPNISLFYFYQKKNRKKKKIPQNSSERILEMQRVIAKY